jgi:hypothetical protein
MKSRIYLFVIVVFMAGTVTSCMESTQSKASTEPKVMSNAEYIQRGEYLVTTIGCNDCHSPKRMGPHGPEIIPELMLSGYQASRPMQAVNMDALKSGWGMFNDDLTTFVGPWGQSFAANLTSDQTGIGNWTEEQFKKAFTQGKYKGIDG